LRERGKMTAIEVRLGQRDDDRRDPEREENTT
jgi:hypothetical protein